MFFGGHFQHVPDTEWISMNTDRIVPKQNVLSLLMLGLQCIKYLNISDENLIFPLLIRSTPNMGKRTYQKCTTRILVLQPSHMHQKLRLVVLILLVKSRTTNAFVLTKFHVVAR